MRVLMFGDRNWDDYWAVVAVVQALVEKYGEADLFIFSGGARGADSQVADACQNLGIAFAEFPAAWAAKGRPAGPIRNGWMMKWGQPELAYGFHNDLKHSKGTADMFRRLNKAGVEHYLVFRNTHTKKKADRWSVVVPDL